MIFTNLIFKILFEERIQMILYLCALKIELQDLLLRNWKKRV